LPASLYFLLIAERLICSVPRETGRLPPVVARCERG